MTSPIGPIIPAASAAIEAPPLPAADTERLINDWCKGRSKETIRAYRTAWTAWTAWADANGAVAIPAAAGALRDYLDARAAAGAGISTLRMAVAAVRAAHDLAGLPDATADRVVRTVMRKHAVEAKDTPQRQARGLDAEAVAVIRRSLAGRADCDPAAARDMALASVMADAGLRRSEAAALQWSDLEIVQDGSGRLTIRSSKTDQTGEGAVVAVTPAAVRDLERWKAFQGEDARGSIFRLGDRQIARRIAALAAAAGLGAGFSGHSGRVGMAQRMTRRGAPAAAVMRQGRWDTPRMVARYTRNESAAEALRYL